jgi:predicted transcriptional regulator
MTRNPHVSAVRVPTCHTRFDDLTDTIEQIANELDMNRSDVHQMTTQLREGIVKKANRDAIKRGGV